MPRVPKPLTDTEVKQAKPRAKEYNLADGGGLYLRIKPNGAKSWLLNYSRPHNRQRANLSFGQYPALPLAKARQMRDESLELLAQGIDPQRHKNEQEQARQEAEYNTLEVVALRWLEVKRSKISADHAADTLRSLQLHIFPRLGFLPLHQVKAPSVIAVLKPIAAKGSLETVKRLCQRMNEIMTHAVNEGLLDANPLSGIGDAFQAPAKRNMPSIAPGQLPALMSTLAAASIKLTTRVLIEWQLHTMTRPGEAAGTRWDEIDEEDMTWTIPAERMKKKRPHTVPLSKQALALLATMRPVSGHREHVFPSDRNPRDPISRQTANMALKRMGYGGALVAHGLRALASTTLNEQGFDPDLIESALAHTDKNEVRGAYNRAQYVNRRKPMMAWWSDHIEKAATGSFSVAGRKGLRAVGGGRA
ncbi:MAG: tyrosine-type recombinase/integrase [Pseudomonadales bacterium]|jgi:integrase|nr:tyrosine-type recombinase/integrase [Pseudomonadales bacterium]